MMLCIAETPARSKRLLRPEALNGAPSAWRRHQDGVAFRRKEAEKSGLDARRWLNMIRAVLGGQRAGGDLN